MFGIKSLGCHEMTKLNITQFDVVNLSKINFFQRQFKLTQA